MSIYLLEIGTEELPYKFIPSAIEQLKTVFEKFLNDNKVSYKDIEVYGTPRRLAVLINELATVQPDEIKIVRGPIERVAYDENHNLSKAGLGFLKKNGLEEKDAYIEDGYLHAKKEIKGKNVVELIKENVPLMILKLQGSHFMRWASNDEKFSRPIRWIVSMLDDKEVPIQIIDVKSSNKTRGHRFAQKVICLGNAKDYVESLRNGCVIVNQDERRQRIIDRAKEEADKLGATPRYNDDLLEEVTYICEYPVPAVCSFDEEYLKIPEEVTVTVMAVHQRYFALYKDGKLINKFITMTNYIGDDFENIKAGNVRVIKARLDDAVFFFNEDTKKSLADYVEDLKGITFQKGMGSVYDKTMRIIELAKQIKDTENIQRTALLCKADLITQLVFEFTELQGFIGADYARVSGENDAVCTGIKEHYFPLNAESELAQGLEGQVVGIADKIDTICAVFAEGKKPTGSSDPLGVRRAALGVIKTILTYNLDINLEELINFAISQLPVKKDCFKDVVEFFNQRLVIYLSETYKKNILEACSSNKSPLISLTDYLKRVKTFTEQDYAPILESANRVIRILKEETNKKVDETLFKEDIERKLFDKINSVCDNADYRTFLNQLIDINPVIEDYFEKVLVMDKDEKIKENRISMLSILKEKYARLADFSRL